MPDSEIEKIKNRIMGFIDSFADALNPDIYEKKGMQGVKQSVNKVIDAGNKFIKNYKTALKDSDPKDVRKFQKGYKSKFTEILRFMKDIPDDEEELDEFGQRMKNFTKALCNSQHPIYKIMKTRIIPEFFKVRTVAQAGTGVITEEDAKAIKLKRLIEGYERQAIGIIDKFVVALDPKKYKDMNDLKNSINKVVTLGKKFVTRCSSILENNESNDVENFEGNYINKNSKFVKILNFMKKFPNNIEELDEFGQKMKLFIKNTLPNTNHPLREKMEKGVLKQFFKIIRVAYAGTGVTDKPAN